jgi:2-oxoglutarate ferredoxin oxidoreductase subunit delta
LGITCEEADMTFWRIPLDAEEIIITKGIVYILEDRCKGCGYCIDYCPKMVLEFSTHFNQKGYHPPFVTKPDDCVNCHYCEIICPEFAIFSVEAPGDQTSKINAPKENN